MKTHQKLAATAALVVVLGVAGLCLRHSRATNARTAGSSSAAPELTIPTLAFSKADAQAISRIELTRPDPDDQQRLHTIILEKGRFGWEIASPIKGEASASKVEALLENLSGISIRLVIDEGSAFYDEYNLTEPKALHVVAWKGQERLRDLYFGKTDPRGQITRVSGVRGVFAVTNWGPDGYSGFLFTRHLRSWRETSILKFAEDDATQIDIVNKNGSLSFTKTNNTWVATRARRDAQGKLANVDHEWRAFDESKVRDLLRNYRSLSADDFGEDADRATSGVDNAEESGGVIRIAVEGRSAPLTVRVGRISTRETPWAIKGNRWAVVDGGIGTLYVLSPWTADWAVSDASRFERTYEVRGASAGATVRPRN
jgi:hypothetical protein